MTSKTLLRLPEDGAEFREILEKQARKEIARGYVLEGVEDAEKAMAEMPKSLRDLLHSLLQGKSCAVRLKKQTVEIWAAPFWRVWSILHTERNLIAPSRERMRKHSYERLASALGDLAKKMDHDSKLPQIYVTLRDRYWKQQVSIQEPDPMLWNETCQKIVEMRQSCKWPTIEEFCQEHRRLCKTDEEEAVKWTRQIEFYLSYQWFRDGPRADKFEHEPVLEEYLTIEGQPVVSPLAELRLKAIRKRNDEVHLLWRNSHEASKRQSLAYFILNDIYGVHLGLFIFRKIDEAIERLRRAKPGDVKPWGNFSDHPFVSTRATGKEMPDFLDIQFIDSGTCVFVPLYLIAKRDLDGTLRRNVDNLHRAMYPQCQTTPFGTSPPEMKSFGVEDVMELLSAHFPDYLGSPDENNQRMPKLTHLREEAIRFFEKNGGFSQVNYNALCQIWKSRREPSIPKSATVRGWWSHH